MNQEIEHTCNPTPEGSQPCKACRPPTEVPGGEERQKWCLECAKPIEDNP